MRRFLIVGCGGSRGGTLAYIMDQLRSELHAAGIHRLLSGWQFVHIDVPSGAEDGPDGLANVAEQGGTYIGCGPQGSSYAILDAALSQRLAAGGALDTIATWAPRNPEEVTNPISTGAGQYRAIGRMITLSKAAEIRARLQAAWEQLFRVETISEMSSVQIPGMGQFDPNEPPLTLVVSSMVGGAGRVPFTDPGVRAGPETDGRLHGDARHLQLTASKRADRRAGQLAGDARRNRGQPGRDGARARRADPSGAG